MESLATSGPFREGMLYVEGKWCRGEGSDWSRRNPFDDSLVWSGRWATSDQVACAMKGAASAFEVWSQTTLNDRIAIAKQFATLLEGRRKELVDVIVAETGKTLWEADTECSAAIGKVQNSIDSIHHRRWVVSDNSGDPTSIIRFRPLGAMVVLGPFNLPAHLPGAHIVPALLAGNAIVFKPSELTPGVGEFLVRTWLDAGLPEGVLQLLHGAGDVAQQMVKDAHCSGVLFTGSYRVGRLLHEALAGRFEVLLALELGGNNPLVVDRTESIEAAVYQIILSAYITSGQRCTCARRLILTRDGAGERLLHRLAEVIPLIQVGDPRAEPQPFLGSLISKDAASKIMAFQENLLSKGATPIHLVRSMKDHPSVLTPGLLHYDRDDANDEEWFGPLLLVQWAEDLDDAIRRANQTRFGLSAGLISDDIDAYHHFVHRVRAGIVNWNRQTTGASGKLPFGGVGASGNHRPSGSFAADYCSFPIASLESQALPLPSQANPGLRQVWDRLKAQ